MPLSFLAPPRRSAFEKIVLSLWWITLLAFACGILLPFRFGLLRLGFLVAAVLLWGGALYLLRRSRLVFAIASVPPVLLAAVALLPGKEVDGERLRSGYLASLRSLEGTTYVWGGETPIGIDCSGLIRLAMIDAAVREGARTANPALLRTAASLWWYDCSAKALGEGYRGWTRPLGRVPDLNEGDYAAIRPGDIAVLESGVHVLAYLGNKTWIQADPVPMRVVRTVAPSTSGWFGQRATILRWTAFDPPAATLASAAPVRR